MTPLRCCKSCNVEISWSLKDLRGTLSLFWGVMINWFMWISPVLLIQVLTVCEDLTLSLWQDPVELWLAALKPVVSLWRHVCAEVLYKLLKSHCKHFTTNHLSHYHLFFLFSCSYSNSSLSKAARSWPWFDATELAWHVQLARFSYCWILVFKDIIATVTHSVIILVVPNTRCHGNRTKIAHSCSDLTPTHLTLRMKVLLHIPIGEPCLIPVTFSYRPHWEPFQRAPPKTELEWFYLEPSVKEIILQCDGSTQRPLRVSPTISPPSSVLKIHSWKLTQP